MNLPLVSGTFDSAVIPADPPPPHTRSYGTYTVGAAVEHTDWPNSIV